MNKARRFLHQLVSFEFLVTFNVTMRVLSSLHSLTVKLQKISSDILAAYEHVGIEQVLTQLVTLKMSVKGHWGH